MLNLLAHCSDVRVKGGGGRGGEEDAPQILVRGGPDSLEGTRFILSAPPSVRMI